MGTKWEPQRGVLNCWPWPRRLTPPWINTGDAWALRFESELLDVVEQMEGRGAVVRRERWLI